MIRINQKDLWGLKTGNYTEICRFTVARDKLYSKSSPYAGFILKYINPFIVIVIVIVMKLIRYLFMIEFDRRLKHK